LSKVFIIGAGFSKALAGLPLSSELAKEIYELSLINPKNHKFLYQYANGFREVYEYYLKKICQNATKQNIYPCENGYVDIEFLVTMIDLCSNSKFIHKNLKIEEFYKQLVYSEPFTNETLEQAKYFIGHGIALILSKEKNKENKDNEKTRQSFVNLLNRGDTIISFNYDLVLENLLMAHNLWEPFSGYKKYGLTLSHREKYTETSSKNKNTIDLIKLHGSINWINEDFHTGDGSNNISFHLCNRTISQPLIQGIPDPIVFHKFAETHYFGNPVIVAPSFLKQFDKPYQIIMMNTAIKQIKLADEIIIMGYSLPKADTTASFLFANIEKTKRVKIVNTDDESKLKQRLQDNYEVNKVCFYPCKIENWLTSGYTCEEYENKVASDEIFEKIKNTDNE